MYRSTFETYAERALGHRVTVLGEADLRLLPAPSISFSDVRVGEAEDPLLVVSRFKMRIELPPLLKGEIRVMEMELDRPHLSLSLDEQGRLDWLTAVTSDGVLAKLPPDDVAFENVTIRDGALSIVDARSGETHRLDNGNLSVSARSLAGPFKAVGSLTLNEAPYNISLATGRAQEERGLRIKGELTPTTMPVNFAFDGMLNQSDAAPSFDGSFNIASVALEENDEKQLGRRRPVCRRHRRSGGAGIRVPLRTGRPAVERCRKRRSGLCRQQAFRSPGAIQSGRSGPAARRRTAEASRHRRSAPTIAGRAAGRAAAPHRWSDFPGCSGAGRRGAGSFRMCGSTLRPCWAAGALPAWPDGCRGARPWRRRET
ncbi:AsmA family protein [Roseibium salinum]|nr:AsmA family protein [Roseibium salinum]